ncbi:hypothetical protein NK6_1852 [Bradyrhizobium diazoefficiens]|uniref:Uncharacterized protein n=1 Tax=Bradyrhizobium diazoefficiens TaxID=1355477 RepID=A0A0E4BLV4_9BRAD|nr:hypothetical protein NK6_1852 [Bradyrhizobium diazoefficiens]
MQNVIWANRLIICRAGVEKGRNSRYSRADEMIE